MDALRDAAREVAARLGDLNETIESRRAAEKDLCDEIIAAVSPAMPAISTSYQLDDLEPLDGVRLAGPEIVECSGMRSGWGLYLAARFGLVFVVHGPYENLAMLPCTVREALDAGRLTAAGLAETLAGLLDAHLHGRAEVRRREYAEILGRMRAASAALRGEG